MLFCRPLDLLATLRFVALAVRDLSDFGSPTTKIAPLSFGDVKFKSEEYISATASTIEDVKKLVEAGFEYVTEIECVKLFRKRK